MAGEGLQNEVGRAADRA